jgi:hypothetical protein
VAVAFLAMTLGRNGAVRPLGTTLKRKCFHLPRCWVTTNADRAFSLVSVPQICRSVGEDPVPRCARPAPKAAFIEQYGGPEVLKYGDLPDPVAGTGEVVIDVVAASVNAADWKVRAGEYARHAQSKFPLIPGRDFAGVISAVGNGVVDLKIDDAVFGVCEAGQEGAYAEKITVKAAIIAKKPEGLSHVNAAALALTGLTAISAVEETLKLQPGETISIQGGAGGVASFAIQFAKHIGARVITTTSAANRDYVAVQRLQCRRRSEQHRVRAHVYRAESCALVPSDNTVSTLFRHRRNQLV